MKGKIIKMPGSQDPDYLTPPFACSVDSRPAIITGIRRKIGGGALYEGIYVDQEAIMSRNSAMTVPAEAVIPLNATLTATREFYEAYAMAVRASEEAQRRGGNYLIEWKDRTAGTGVAECMERALADFRAVITEKVRAEDAGELKTIHETKVIKPSFGGRGRK
ncbi:MAG: hypothetical protein IKO41_09010 [Lachnospiraceae bacterium]|nr:hypothetical protein [Lachnospiraceae bacterium]